MQRSCTPARIPPHPNRPFQIAGTAKGPTGIWRHGECAGTRSHHLWTAPVFRFSPHTALPGGQYRNRYPGSPGEKLPVPRIASAPKSYGSTREPAGPEDVSCKWETPGLPLHRKSTQQPRKIRVWRHKRPILPLERLR